MKSLCEKQKEISLGGVVDILGLLISAAGFMCDLIFQGVFKNELPRFLFSLIFFGLLFFEGLMSISAYKKLRRQRSRYERQRDEFLESDDGSDVAGGYRAARKKEIDAEKRFRNRRRRIRTVKGLQILAVAVLEVFLCLRNPINSLALWNAVFVGEGQSEEADLELEAEPTVAEVAEVGSASNGQEDEETAAEDLGPLKPLTFRFILEEPDRKPDLEPDIESAVFCLDKKAEQTLEEYIDAALEEITACRRAGTDIQTLEDGDGYTFYTYTEAENVFKRNVEACQKEKYYYIWAGKAPTSAELDRYMEGREKLNLAEQDGRQGSRELWWKLANDNQYYALEYEAQTQNGDAVLYYYAMSIFCTMEALKYDMPKEQRRQIYHYMVMRYHDIGGMTLEIPLAYKEMAEDIYRCLAKNDEMLETEKEDAGLETDDAV